MHYSDTSFSDTTMYRFKVYVFNKLTNYFIMYLFIILPNVIILLS